MSKTCRYFTVSWGLVWSSFRGDSVSCRRGLLGTWNDGLWKESRVGAACLSFHWCISMPSTKRSRPPTVLSSEWNIYQVIKIGTRLKITRCENTRGFQCTVVNVLRIVYIEWAVRRRRCTRDFSPHIPQRYWNRCIARSGAFLHFVCWWSWWILAPLLFQSGGKCSCRF